MVFFALWTGRSDRYRLAAAHLRSCEQLAARIDDWQGHPDHHSHRLRLEQMFGRQQGILEADAGLTTAAAAWGF